MGYDTEAPQFGAFSRPAVLVLSKANGFVHEEALPAGQAMLERIGAAIGWDVFCTDNAATHNEDDLAKFSAVVWNNVSGDVLTTQQRQAFRQWMEFGGGWLGLHASGGDLAYDWRWYLETLLRAQFVGHTLDPHLQDADVLVARPGDPVTCELPVRWRIPAEEWYAFDASPVSRGSEVLLTLDTSSYVTRGQMSPQWRDDMSGEHPVAWRHDVNAGRAAYCSIGHCAATYDNQLYVGLVTGLLAWVAGLEGA